jgi:hypothetical protein
MFAEQRRTERLVQDIEVDGHARSTTSRDRPRPPDAGDPGPPDRGLSQASEIRHSRRRPIASRSGNSRGTHRRPGLRRSLRRRGQRTSGGPPPPAVSSGHQPRPPVRGTARRPRPRRRSGGRSARRPARGDGNRTSRPSILAVDEGRVPASRRYAPHPRPRACRPR